MFQTQTQQETTQGKAFDDLSSLCRIGGFAAIGLLAYTVATMAHMAILGMGVPPDAASVFAMLRSHKLMGLLRLDLLTVVALPLYYLLFLGLFAALRRVDRAKCILATALAFVGTTLVLATPAPLPMIALGEKYAGAVNDAAKAQLSAAGEAVMASDMWHSTGAKMGGILLQSGAVLMCAVMLRGGVFSKTVAWLGIVMHALDLTHIVSGLFLPLAGAVLMAIAGVLYPVWFLMVGTRLLKLARTGT